MSKEDKFYSYMDKVMDGIFPGTLLSDTRTHESNLKRLAFLLKKTSKDCSNGVSDPENAAKVVKRGIKLYKM